MPDAITPPKTGGESTGAQAKGGNAMATILREVIVSGAQPRGFAPPKAGTYDLYREISAHPTVGLIKEGIVKPPVASNTWVYAKRGTGSRARRLPRAYRQELASGVPDERVNFIRDCLDPLRTEIVRQCLFGTEYGWGPGELIYARKRGDLVLDRFKPLMVDITEQLIDDHGNRIGLRNKSPEGEPVDITGPQAFCFIYDPQPGMPYGRSRHENLRRNPWPQIQDTALRVGQYMKRLATPVPQLHYPEGTSADATGAPRPNQWLAEQILTRVMEGRGVAFPNKYASFADLSQGLEFAGKSEWVLSYNNPAPTDHLPGIGGMCKYYDDLICRGWYVPERAALQATTAGSRADSKTHTDSASITAEMLDRAIADCVNQQIVNVLLVLNYGPDAKDSVYVDCPPIEDNAVQIFGQLLQAELANPQIGPWLAEQIDNLQLLDYLGVPISENADGNQPIILNDPSSDEEDEGGGAGAAQRPRKALTAPTPTSAGAKPSGNGGQGGGNRIRDLVEKNRATMAAKINAKKAKPRV
jgi:hypothetical protein